MSYGNNLELTDDFDFKFDKVEKSLTIISGDDNLVQNTKIILNTLEGENKFVPNFGTRLQDLIGKRASDNFIKYTVRNALIKDQRISSVDKIYVAKTKDGIVNLRIFVTTVDGEELELTGGLSWRNTV